MPGKWHKFSVHHSPRHVLIRRDSLTAAENSRLEASPKETKCNQSCSPAVSFPSSSCRLAVTQSCARRRQRLLHCSGCSWHAQRFKRVAHLACSFSGTLFCLTTGCLLVRLFHLVLVFRDKQRHQLSQFCFRTAGQAQKARQAAMKLSVTV